MFACMYCNSFYIVTIIIFMKTHDIYTFTESLKDIFRTPSLFHLLQGITIFTLVYHLTVNQWNANFVNPGMYTCGIIPVEHRDSYSVFYKEITGKALQRVLISDPTMTVLKRKAQGIQVRSQKKNQSLRNKSQMTK